MGGQFENFPGSVALGPLGAPASQKGREGGCVWGGGIISYEEQTRRGFIFPFLLLLRGAQTRVQEIVEQEELQQ